MNTIPKVFISYSWTSPVHEDKVINLAQRLVADGIDVKIDKWDLKTGHDKYSFMESMVTSTEIDKVLIILDQKYALKADGRSGGVGTETQIISKEVYDNVSQEKFIPIIFERDEDGKEFMPTYLKNRIYIDLSIPEHYEDNYEKLLRSVFERPSHSKPKIGKAPSYLFEDTPITHKTTFILRGLDNTLERNPQKLDYIFTDFLNEFFKNLADYSITFSNRDYLTQGKEIIDNLNNYSSLRNDFIHFYTKIVKEGHSYDIDILIKFLERLPMYKSPLDGRNSWSGLDFDNFKFIIHEIFLYIIAINLKYERYTILEEIFNSPYFMYDKYSKQPKSFVDHYNHIDSIDIYYKETYSKNFYSPMADFMIKRIPEEFEKSWLIEADLLCHYIATLKSLRWFPITYIYKSDDRFDLFERLISKKHFDKVKLLFNVNSVDEFKTVIENLKSNSNYNRFAYNGSFDSVTPLYNLIDVDQVGTMR